MRRVVAVVISILMLAALLVVGPATPAPATPIATTEEQYLAYGRVFPDPQGCNHGQPGYSPFAKGNVCAFDFLQFAELKAGLDFLDSIEGFGNFMEIYTLHEDFACNGKPVGNPDSACKNFRSAGIPVTASAQQGEGFTRERAPLYMVRVTDESVPDKDKDFFVFPLSIHGIERAGAEGGTRAIEDLVTWAACEQSPNLDMCPNEEPIPHPILEATPKKSLTAGDVLERAVVYFIYPNPDGWLRGERTQGAQFYQRYNGNGVDLNRDWPEQGYTFRPYTPWSEPESVSYGRVLQAIGPKDARGNPKWTGGIDLHGQLIDRAFSFTLIGGSQRPYDKNQRVLQTVKGAWSDAEKRLAWSPLIKANDAPEDDPRVYGVQWGTIWDTIDYTVTGALGNWIDSPIGLNADGIDNEMSLSHVSNCGIGSCFDPDVEQLHVDGNKSLIYSMLNYSLKRENNTFRTNGRVGWVANHGFVSERTDRLTAPPEFTKLPAQEDISGSCPADDTCLRPDNDYTYEFKVNGPKQGVYNGGIAATLTCSNVQGVGGCALSEARLERRNPGEASTQGEGEWEVVNSYFNQSAIYIQAGQALHANLPVPGDYRVRIVGSDTAGIFDTDINFTREKGWPDPGQVGYRVTNMKFWKDLAPFTKPRITKVTPSEIRTGASWQRLDTIVITDKVYKPLAKKLRRWVARRDGNLVLLDSALKMLRPMGIIKGKASMTPKYLGYVNFATVKREVTYRDPLARKINQPGAAEGMSGGEVHRRQTYEAVPIGYAIQGASGDGANNSPVYWIPQSVWKKARGWVRAVGTTGSTSNVSYGEIKYHGGRIRILGALLPMPTKRFDNPFGVANYAITYSGYQLLKNMLQWESLAN